MLREIGLCVVMTTLAVGCSNKQGYVRTSLDSQRDFTRTAHEVHVSDRKRHEKSADLRRELLEIQQYLASGDFDAATRLATTAVRTSPDSVDAHTYLAVALDRNGDEAGAGKHYQRAAELSPSGGAALSNYGTWLWAQGRAAESLAWFDRAIAVPGYPNQAMALANAGICAVQAGAFGINRHGEVVGWTTLPNETDEIVHAVSWNRDGITDMNPFQSDLSVASSINTKGEIVGAYLTSEGLLRAVLWGKQGVRELGTLGGDESEAYWINDKGEAVRWCELLGGGWHACLWSPHGDTVDLGALDGLYSEAYSINDHGKVVGSVFLDKTLETSRAFIWTRKGGMQDLNTLVDLPDGVLVAHANSINDFGWIAGTADSGSACLLIPYKSGKEMKALRDSFKR